MPARIFTDSQVRKARKLYRSGQTLAQLAAAFGASEATMGSLIAGHTYKHVADKNGPAPMRVGRPAPGSAHHHAKLTEREIPLIRQLRRERWTNIEIAERFGVSDFAVRCVLNGETWSHVPDPPDPKPSGLLRPNRPNNLRRGSTSPAAVLTEEAVVQIRSRYREGHSVSHLADEHGVGEETIRKVLSGRTWNHVPDPMGPIILNRYRDSRGERNHMAVLNNEGVRLARELYRAGHTIEQLEQQYGRGVGDMLRGLTWKHVGDPLGPIMMRSRGQRKAIDRPGMVPPR